MDIKKEKKFQNKLVKDLQTGKLGYGNASIYTILLELTQGNDIEHIKDILKDIENESNRRI